MSKKHPKPTEEIIYVDSIKQLNKIYNSCLKTVEKAKSGKFDATLEASLMFNPEVILRTTHRTWIYRLKQNTD